jgi:hypothetical protein
MSSGRALSSPDMQAVCRSREPQRVGMQRRAYAVPSHDITDAARSAGASACGLWPRWARIAAHVPDQFVPRLPGWGRAHCRDRGACGAGAAAAPLVAALVASQAAKHLATGVVHRPRSLVGPHASRPLVRSPCNARSSVFIRMRLSGLGGGPGMWAPVARPPHATLAESPMGRFACGTPQPSRVYLGL